MKNGGDFIDMRTFFCSNHFRSLNPLINAEKEININFGSFMLVPFSWSVWLSWENTKWNKISIIACLFNAGSWGFWITILLANKWKQKKRIHKVETIFWYEYIIELRYTPTINVNSLVWFSFLLFKWTNDKMLWSKDFHKICAG